MKKFKDVAHLYIGCEVVSVGKKPGTKHYQLIGITIGGGLVFKTIPEGFSIVLASDWKPLLRPLDSMTEEDKKEVGFDAYHMLRNEHGDRVIPSKEKGFVWAAKQTAYLLSKGYDLFSLIPNGEAIDKTKLLA